MKNEGRILASYAKRLNTGELNEIRRVYLELHKIYCERKLTYGEYYYKLQAGQMIEHILKDVK